MHVDQTVDACDSSLGCLPSQALLPLIINFFIFMAGLLLNTSTSACYTIFGNTSACRSNWFCLYFNLVGTDGNTRKIS